MLRYLNGESNRRGRPNENYARELMELFCLGVTDTSGNPNYTETDVRELARALSGWTIDTTDPNNPRGVFNASRFDNLSKSFLGSIGNFSSLGRPSTSCSLTLIMQATSSQAVVGVRHHPSRRRDACRSHRHVHGNGLRSAAAAEDLTHPQLFDSLAEPTLIKPPIVYLVGGFRQVGLNVTNTGPYSRLNGDGAGAVLPAQRLGLGVRVRVPDDERRAQPLGFGSDLAGASTRRTLQGRRRRRRRRALATATIRG